MGHLSLSIDHWLHSYDSLVLYRGRRINSLYNEAGCSGFLAFWSLSSTKESDVEFRFKSFDRSILRSDFWDDISFLVLFISFFFFWFDYFPFFNLRL